VLSCRALPKKSRVSSAKRLGVIGGIGPESTIAYYRQLIAAYQETRSNDAYPSIVINSIDVKRVLDLAANDLPALADYLLLELDALGKAGASLGLIAANTPHIVFDDIVGRSPIPLVSIVEATCDAALALGLKRVGLLGTRFTMQGRFYPQRFDKAAITVIVPRADEQNYIHDRYVGELVKGTFLPRTREGLLRIVELMRERDAVQAVILAGTELPLILNDPASASVPLLDTTHIHVRAAADRLWPPGSPVDVRAARSTRSQRTGFVKR
jgi:aspartate racemase